MKPQVKRKLSTRAKFCETCGQVRLDGPRHKFTFPSHVLRRLTPEWKDKFCLEEDQSGSYRLDFGKHKKRSVQWLQKEVPSYIAWIVRERIYAQRPKLKQPLISEGLFPESLLNVEDEKERCKRALEVIQSWRAPEDDVSDSKHIVPTTVASEEAPLVAVTDLAKTGKQTEKKKRHQKYMHPSSQQTVAYAQKQRNALVELHRLSALDFAKAMREYGLFEDLIGQPCQKPECSTAKGFGAEGGSVLGGLSASSTGRIPGSDITLKDCCYRCLKCREGVPVTLGNVYFLPELEEVTVQRILSEN